MIGGFLGLYPAETEVDRKEKKESRGGPMGGRGLSASLCASGRRRSGIARAAARNEKGKSSCCRREAEKRGVKESSARGLKKGGLEINGGTYRLGDVRQFSAGLNILSTRKNTVALHRKGELEKREKKKGGKKKSNRKKNGQSSCWRASEKPSNRLIRRGPTL